MFELDRHARKQSKDSSRRLNYRAGIKPQEQLFLLIHLGFSINSTNGCVINSVLYTYTPVHASHTHTHTHTHPHTQHPGAQQDKPAVVVPGLFDFFDVRATYPQAL